MGNIFEYNISKAYGMRNKGHFQCAVYHSGSHLVNIVFPGSYLTVLVIGVC